MGCVKPATCASGKVGETESKTSFAIIKVVTGETSREQHSHISVKVSKVLKCGKKGVDCYSSVFMAKKPNRSIRSL